ncbi:MAG: hypothetical protein ACRD2N_04170, partial [Vicinamibacterales bacterium]
RKRHEYRVEPDHRVWHRRRSRGGCGRGGQAGATSSQARKGRSQTTQGAEEESQSQTQGRFEDIACRQTAEAEAEAEAEEAGAAIEARPMRGAWCAAALLVAAAAEAQSPPCPTPPVSYEDHWCGPLKEIRDGLRSGALKEQADIERLVRLQGANLRAFLLYAQAHGESTDLRSVEEARIDKQVGAPGNGAGSTSAVSKGAVPSILGIAVENGALTQTTSDTTVTLRGNLVGWLDLIKNQGFIASYQDDGAFVRQLRRVSYSFTLNTDTGETAAAPSGLGGFSPAAIRKQLSETGQQLAGYSVRFAVWDQRDPRTAKNRAAVATMLTPAIDAALKADNFLADVLNSTEYNFKWLPETATLLNNPTLDEKGLSRVLYRQLEVIRLHMINRIDGFDERVTKALLALEGYDKARLKVFQAMQRRPLVAAEYVVARDRELPDKATWRVIAEGQWGPRLDLTANVSWTLQRPTTPVSSGSTGRDLRDFQAAAQLEAPLASAEKVLASTSGIGVPSIALAYLSQKLNDTATIAFAGNTFTLEEGWIHVVQAKVTLPVKGSGVKVPLSISFANRTELLKEKTIRGHVGLTFDLDVLSALRR